MKTILKLGAQGDVVFRRLTELPPGLTRQQPDAQGRLVVAHSETGHHHAIEADGVIQYAGADPLRCYLALESIDYCEVVHHRSFHTHETVALGGGAGAVWEVLRQREFSPEGDRRVQD